MSSVHFSTRDCLYEAAGAWTDYFGVWNNGSTEARRRARTRPPSVRRRATRPRPRMEERRNVIAWAEKTYAKFAKKRPPYRAA